MAGFQKPVTKQCIKNILKQMGNTFYKIYINGESSFTGIFCYIKYRKINIPVLIINKYIKFEYINQTIRVMIKNDFITIRLGEIKYNNKEHNITILEVIENKNVHINYMELDDLLLHFISSYPYFSLTLNSEIFKNIKII